MSDPSEELDVETIDRLVEIAKNLPPVSPSRWKDGREYYWLPVGSEQAEDVLLGRVEGMKPASVTADQKEDGSWAVAVLDAEGAPLLFCSPGFYCRVANVSMAELAKTVGIDLVKP